MSQLVSSTSPVARFFYKGSHGHPVRRTVLVVQQTRRYISGYELREGNNIRTFKEAPVKTYAIAKIAKNKNLRKDNPLRSKNPNNSTLIKCDLIDLVTNGV